MQGEKHLEGLGLFGLLLVAGAHRSTLLCRSAAETLDCGSAAPLRLKRL